KTRGAIPLSSLEILGRHLAVPIVLNDVETELLTFDERTHPCALDGRDVEEHVRLAIPQLDEAEALGRIEKLNSASIHDDFLSIVHRNLLAAQAARQTVQLDFE